MIEKIPFNSPYMTGRELQYISEAKMANMLAGDGGFSRKVHLWLENNLKTEKALLTHSCTAALEMAAILADIQPGDEVIIPSYTFVSTANAFVLRGGVPVFVDIREDTLNLDEKLIEGALTGRTKAIVPVHYAGVGCEMDKIMSIAKNNNLMVIEDAAQAVMSKYKGKMLGAIGNLGALSFHETKNLISGEGGALLVNSNEFLKRAEIIREKGTDRSRFFKGEVDKYTWCDIGSSYLPGEIIAAFLYAQLEEAQTITQKRIDCWNVYNQLLSSLEVAASIRRPTIPDDCQHNAHMYYVLLAKDINRSNVINELKSRGIHAVFHYVPLHDSVGGKRFGRVGSSMSVTTDISERLLRLPLWIGLTVSQQEYIVQSLKVAIDLSR